MNANAERVEALYHNYSAFVFCTLRARVLTHEEAEDLTQEVFARALSSLPQELPFPGGWLYQVALHIAYDYARARKRKQHQEGSFSLSETLPGEDGQERTYEELITYSLYGEPSDALLDLHTAFRQLPTPLCCLLWLSACGYSVPELVQLSGWSKAIIYRKLKEARSIVLTHCAEVL